MKDQRLKVKSTSSMAKAIRQLELLIETMRKGNISIVTRQEAVVIKTRPRGTLSMKASVSRDKEAVKGKLLIEMKWKSGEDDDILDQPFSIGSLSLHGYGDKDEEDCTRRPNAPEMIAGEFPRDIPSGLTVGPEVSDSLRPKRRGASETPSPSRKRTAAAPKKNAGKGKAAPKTAPRAGRGKAVSINQQSKEV